MLSIINFKSILTDRNTNIPMPHMQCMRDLESMSPPRVELPEDELIPLDPSVDLNNLPPDLEQENADASKQRYENLKRVWENKDFGGVFTDYKPKIIEVLENEEELNKQDPAAMQILSNMTNVKHELRELNKLIKNSENYVKENSMQLQNWLELNFYFDKNLKLMMRQKKFLQDQLKSFKDQKENLITTKKREAKAMEIHARIKVQLGEMETYELRNNVTAAEYMVSINAIETDIKHLHRMGLKVKKGTKTKLEKFKRILDGMREQDKLVDEELKDLMQNSFNSQESDEVDEQNDTIMEEKNPSQPPPKKKQRIDVFVMHHEVQPN